jgi:hypothetical protein
LEGFDTYLRLPAAIQQWAVEAVVNVLAAAQRRIDALGGCLDLLGPTERYQLECFHDTPQVLNRLAEHYFAKFRQVLGAGTPDARKNALAMVLAFKHANQLLLQVEFLKAAHIPGWEELETRPLLDRGPGAEE